MREILNSFDSVKLVSLCALLAFPEPPNFEEYIVDQIVSGNLPGWKIDGEFLINEAKAELDLTQALTKLEQMSTQKGLY